MFWFYIYFVSLCSGYVFIDMFYVPQVLSMCVVTVVGCPCFYFLYLKYLYILFFIRLVVQFFVTE